MQKIGCGSAIKVNFIALALHYLCTEQLKTFRKDEDDTLDNSNRCSVHRPICRDARNNNYNNNCTFRKHTKKRRKLRWNDRQYLNNNLSFSIRDKSLLFAQTTQIKGFLYMDTSRIQEIKFTTPSLTLHTNLLAPNANIWYAPTIVSCTILNDRCV